jgi:hypothetical protein
MRGAGRRHRRTRSVPRAERAGNADGDNMGKCVVSNVSVLDYESRNKRLSVFSTIISVHIRSEFYRYRRAAGTQQVEIGHNKLRKNIGLP